MRDASPTSFAEFGARAASNRFVPVWLTAPCATQSTVNVFNAIAPDGRGFILDGVSPEQGASRYAYAGVGDQFVFGPGETNGGNPFHGLRSLLLEISPLPRSHLPFTSGVAGYVAYEAARHVEPVLEPLRADPIGVPEAAFIRPTRMIAFDREEQNATAVVFVDTLHEEMRTAYGLAMDECQELLKLVESVSTDSQALPAEVEQPGQSFEKFVEGSHVTRSEYERRVQAARDAIIAGELIQVVLTQRIERTTAAAPLDVYRELARLNPSPYMFYMGFGPCRSAPGGFHLVGASPELMTRVQNRIASVHPIAGTRARSRDGQEDVGIEAALASSEKERAEHIMLVDLARNDLGRVCEPGTVEVPYLMRTERYSHVMHLVSRVRGRLRPGLDGLAAFEAGFPIGTLAGAPKVRAMQLISELEHEGRGPYCGGVGWFGANGDLDTGTVIRSIVFKDGVAHVQGGGGVVFDSDPSAEYEESLRKMTAQLEAIAIAEDGQSANPADRHWRSPVTANA